MQVGQHNNFKAHKLNLNVSYELLNKDEYTNLNKTLCFTIRFKHFFLCTNDVLLVIKNLRSALITILKHNIPYRKL